MRSGRTKTLTEINNVYIQVAEYYHALQDEYRKGYFYSMGCWYKEHDTEEYEKAKIYMREFNILNEKLSTLEKAYSYVVDALFNPSSDDAVKFTLKKFLKKAHDYEEKIYLLKLFYPLREYYPGVMDVVNDTVMKGEEKSNR